MICTFCQKTYFLSAHWPTHSPKPHHTSLTTWAQSIHQPCTICTLLLENLRSALIDPTEASFEDQSTSVGTTPYYEVLLAWLERAKGKLEGLMPVYEVEVLDGGARCAWVLRCRGGKGAEERGDEVRGRVKEQRFHVYATYYDGKKDTTIPRLAVNSGDPQTFDQIRHWMKECDEKHPACKHLQETRDWMPTRVIDVGKSNADVRLVKTAELKQTERYMTLSHCWGDPGPSIVTLKGNVDQHLKQLPYEDLALTFRHAITITRKLGLQYVWIDSLCIIQKDDDEWAKEGPTMETVYGNSFLNIAAVSSRNSTQGMFRNRHPNAPSPSITKVRWAGQSADCYVMREDFWDGELLSEPLYKRGWVFQERMLSPRMLHYQKRQVWWQCLGQTCCEAIPGGLSRVVYDEQKDELRWRQILYRDRKGARPDDKELDDLSQIWRLAAKSYKACNLTMEKDKLMALASIASAVRKLLDRRYVAGMWGEGDLLVDQFAWEMEVWGKGGDKPDWAKLKGDQYTAPSWSWMHLDGVVKVPTLVTHGDERKYTLQIQDKGKTATLKLFDEKFETGVLKSAQITVKGELFRLTFVAQEKGDKEWRWEDASTQSGTDRSWSCLYLDQPLEKTLKEEETRSKLANGLQGNDGRGAKIEAAEDAKDKRWRLTCCVLMLFYDEAPDSYDLAGFSGYGLALQPQGDKFSRVGLFRFRNFSDMSWKRLQERRADTEGRRYQGTPKEFKRGEKGFHEEVTLI